MSLAERQQRLDSVLQDAYALWHPQPFRERRPAWSDEYPALTAQLLNLDDLTAEHLNRDGHAARQLLARHFPAIADLDAISDFPAPHEALPFKPGGRWAWEIPGRKRRQIEAFAAATRPTGLPVLDWCAGKGHLGRLLALQWTLEVSSLEIDPQLCADGRQLAMKAQATQQFACKNALTAGDVFSRNQHAVALHACGDLHRRLITAGAQAGVAYFDIAPCCYHRGLGEAYQPLSAATTTPLTRDDVRLAVTETITASPRLIRQRDKEMAWKLGFDVWRRKQGGELAYRSFKSVPAAWFRDDFSHFAAAMALREQMPLPEKSLTGFEALGWQRQREVMRLSIVRHAFRRPLEILLVQDLGLYLAAQGYKVSIGSFCERQLTPRNLLISACRG